MEFITESEKRLKVKYAVDVLICGGGSAGVAAAVAAARSGANTLVIESQGCLGGMSSAGFMNRLGPYHDQKKMILGGIPVEVVERLAELNAIAMPRPCPRKDKDNYWTPFDPEAMKYILDQMLTEAGVKILFKTLAVDVISDNGCLRGIIIESKSGREAILAEVVIDCTGDGDIAALAGVPFTKGRAEDGWMQPMGLLSKVHNLDRQRALEFISANREHLEKIKKDIGNNDAVIACGTDNLLRKDETYYNADHGVNFDGTRSEDLTDIYLQARKQIWINFLFAQKYIPGFENAYICGTAAQLGVRESRQIEGEYILTGEDVLGAKKFSDRIAKYACYIDIHCSNEKCKGKELPPGQSYDIPFRSLIAKAITNLLVAGRCFSATHEAMASARMIPSCMAMGQAAGTAAALSVKQKLELRKLDVERLQFELRKQKVII